MNPAPEKSKPSERKLGFFGGHAGALLRNGLELQLFNLQDRKRSEDNLGAAKRKSGSQPFLDLAYQGSLKEAGILEEPGEVKKCPRQNDDEDDRENNPFTDDEALL